MCNQLLSFNRKLDYGFSPVVPKCHSSPGYCGTRPVASWDAYQPARRSRHNVKTTEQRLSGQSSVLVVFGS